MGTLRPRRCLRCFYCGQKSNIRFEAQTSFDCSNCDATNWLDRNGEITDPPAATEVLEHNNVQYAIPRPLPPRSPSPLDSATGSLTGESIFCAACLRNQHMLNSSLAQFEWPDAATGAEHSARERKYWALKKELEKRYPQVCEDCLPKVNKKLNQASYTAQTDHLKRMVNRTRSQRGIMKKRGPLDVLDCLGELSWYAGFALQAAWHLTVVALLVTESYASTPHDGHWIHATLVLFVRFVALSIAQYSKSRRLPATTQLSAQLVILLLMVHVYFTAKKSIHTDTTPLFRQPVPLAAGLHAASDERSATKDPSDLGNVLDSILNSSTAQRDQAARTSPQQSTSLTASLGSPMHGNGGEPPITHEDDEMDWSPSASQHRAFSSYNPYKVKNTNPRFSDVPTEPKPGPIWYKVPPAPTNPAHRSRNPPMRPIIRESPKEKQESFFQSTGRQPIEFTAGSQEDSAKLNLALPKFYAPEPKDDPRDGLLSLFENSFSLSPSPEVEKRERHFQKTSTSGSHAQGDATIPNRTMTRIAEFFSLLAALCGWIFALGSAEHYGRSVALASICVCLIVSIRLAADLEVDHQIRGDARPSVFMPSFANLALVQVMAVILLMWNIWSGSSTSTSSGVYGNTLFGSIIIHHMWHMFA
ncbi:hypothetical protein E0Z10_g8321 [Xylaria hypoxylon]|uniref:Ima1 N-terminal domain-containing protein n=1 Tax=Xylaria hypoxylon TaxID=37992 RepID=A0A4Z0Y8E7_9PEZI|nr:hypothetical protein E0Z10_g8321 [Xylaria hypoxylon]